MCLGCGDDGSTRDGGAASHDAANQPFVDGSPTQAGPLDAAADSGTRDAARPQDAAPPRDATSGERDATVDATVPADAGPPLDTTWLGAETTLDDGQIRIEKVRYRSGSLTIAGQVCRRVNMAAPAPVMIVNHGGFDGIVDWNGGPCASLARDHGYVVAQSSYRGEDGSDGAIEVCLGEVDDVLALTHIVLAQPYADPDQVMMYGASHGGCITLRAIERGAPVHSAVALVPPTDFAALHAFWQAGLSDPGASELERNVWTTLSEVVETAAGKPAAEPAAYAARSPLSFATELDALAIPMLVLHGTTDYLVPGAQGCTLAAATPGFESHYVIDGAGTVSTQAPAACASAQLDWRPTAPPSNWPGKRYFMLYEGMGHGFDGPTGQLALTHTAQFIFTKNPPR